MIFCVLAICDQMNHCRACVRITQNWIQNILEYEHHDDDDDDEEVHADAAG